MTCLSAWSRWSVFPVQMDDVRWIKEEWRKSNVLYSIVISYPNMVLVVTALLLSCLQTCHDVSWFSHFLSWLPNLGHCRGQNVPYNLVLGPSYCCTKLATRDVCIKNFREEWDKLTKKLTNLNWSARFRNKSTVWKAGFHRSCVFFNWWCWAGRSHDLDGNAPTKTHKKRRCYGRTRRSQSVFLALGVLFVSFFFFYRFYEYIYTWSNIYIYTFINIIHIIHIV